MVTDETEHGLGTNTGGLGTGWARAGHEQIVSERHGYPLVITILQKKHLRRKIKLEKLKFSV
jgi:hypothetical protein